MTENPFLFFGFESQPARKGKPRKIDLHENLIFQATFVACPKYNPPFVLDATYCKKRIKNGHYWFIYNGEVVAEIRRMIEPHCWRFWEYRSYGGKWYPEETLNDCTASILDFIAHDMLEIDAELTKERRTLYKLLNKK